VTIYLNWHKSGHAG